MTLLAQLRSLVAGLFRRDPVEKRMHEEIRFHIDTRAADLIRSGLSPREAERRARIEFGAVEAVREDCRQARGLQWFDDLRGDLRYGSRMLRRNPVFAAVAVLSLGLGIGANTAIFSLVDTLLLRSLPVQRPERLFFVDSTGGKSDGRSAPPYPCYETLRDGNRHFSGIAAFKRDLLKVTIDGNAEQIRGQYVSGNYFEVLGVPAVHGRILTPADDLHIGRGGAEGAVGVISYALWQRRFAMSPSVLGKAVQVGTNWVTIVGITPPEFFGLAAGSPIDITVPITLAGNNLRQRTTWWYSAVGRLRDDAAPEQARAELDGMFQAYMKEIDRSGHLKYFDRIALVAANKGVNELRRQFSKPLTIVMTIVALVLLIGCANVANLLLARATARQSEISVRLSIGASRGRLVRQMLTEGLLLAAMGTLMGLLFARWGVALLASFLQNQIVLDPHFDFRVLTFTAAVAILTGVLFSIAPALHATRSNSANAAESARLTTTKPRQRLRQALVVVQIALSLTLLCGAALFIRTLHNLTSLDAGFSREGTLTMRVDATLPQSRQQQQDESQRIAERAQIGRIWETLAARVSAQPGIRAASAATLTPLSGRDRGVKIAVVGGPFPDRSDAGIHLNQVTAAYFEAFGMRLRGGRFFTPRDRSDAPRVAVLNDTAVRFYFGEENPMGRRVTFPGQPVSAEYEIVGVVQDARYENLRLSPERMVYLPIEQAIDRITGVMLAVRAGNDATDVLPAIREEVQRAVPGGFVTSVRTLEQQADASLVQERLLSMLGSFFGALALVLACIGLYGVMSYAVVRRTREIGIRLAVGAQRNSLVWLVLRETIVLIGVALAIGIPAVLGATTLVRSELFGLSPGDPVALGSAILVLLCITVAAGFVPARRASRVDPMIALRHD